MAVAVLFVGTGVFAVMYRFIHLNYGFSFDEAFAAYVATLPWQTLLSVVQAEGRNPPLYYALLKAWSGLVGNGDVALRVLSSLMGALGVITFAWFVRSWWGKRAGIVAFAFASSLVVWVVMSREVRMYALLMLLIVLCIGTFWRWYRWPTAWNAVAYVGVVMLALLTHLTVAPVVVAQALFLILSRRPLRQIFRRCAVVAVAPLAVAAGWFVPVLAYWQSHPIGYTVLNVDSVGLVRGSYEVLRDYSAFHHGTYSMSTGTMPLFFVARGLMIAVVAVALVAVVLRVLRSRTSPMRRDDRQLLLLFVLTLVCSVLLTAVLRPFPKYFLPACISFIAISTYGVTLLWRRSWVVAAVVALVLFVSSMTGLPAVIRGQPLPWHGIAHAIEQDDRPGDLVLVHLWPDELTLRRYSDGTLDIRGVLPIATPEEQSYATTLAQYNPAQVVTGENIGPWLTAATAGRTRIWLVFINNDSFFNGTYVEEWFKDGAWSVSSTPDIRYAPKGTVTLYERSTP